MKNILFSFLIIFLSLSIYADGTACRFAVFTDAHLYDTILGTEGREFVEYLNGDRKLLKESSAIMDVFVSRMEAEKPEFILFAGDMTKDGETVNHMLFKKYAERLESCGIELIAVNGNHDIVNADAWDFKNKKKTESITPDVFRNLYLSSSKIISRDEKSLSYVYEVRKGLRIIALDGCRYMENPFEEHPIVGGFLKRETLEWAEENLEDANMSGCMVIALMHHGIIEHFSGQKDSYEDYILSNAEALKELFFKYGVSLVFTGHFHANDISSETRGGKTLFDIETGSLVTYPCPYRIVEIGVDGKAEIRTFSIDSIDGIGSGFADYSREFIKTGIKHIVNTQLPPFLIPERERAIIGERISEMFCMHYAGDESYDPQLLDFSKFSFFSRIVASMKGKMFKGLLTDSVPDRNVIIDTGTGKISGIY